MPFTVTSTPAKGKAETAVHATAEAAVRDAIFRLGIGHDEVRITAPDGQSYHYGIFPELVAKHGRRAIGPGLQEDDRN